MDDKRTNKRAVDLRRAYRKARTDLTNKAIDYTIVSGNPRSTLDLAEQEDELCDAAEAYVNARKRMIGEVP